MLILLNSIDSSKSLNKGDRDEYNNVKKYISKLCDIEEEVTLEKVFLEMLQTQEYTTLKAIAELDCSLVNCSLLEEIFIKYYLDPSRTFQGLRALEVVGSNFDFGAQVFDKVMKSAGEMDLEKAYQWSLKNGHNDSLIHGIHELGSLYATGDTPESKVPEVLDSNMDIFTKASFLSGLIKDWTKKDSESSLKYFATLPKSESLDWVLFNNMESISEVDPVAALQWADYIQDEDFRTHKIREINIFWEKSDPETYLKWVEQNAE